MSELLEPIDLDGDGKISPVERLLFLLIVFCFGKELIPLLI